MFFDSHVHSAASPDSEMPPGDAIAAVKKLGLGIAFTEHVDFADHFEKDPNATDAPRGIGDFVCDFSRYPAEYQKFRGGGVTLGLEFAITRAFFQINKKLADGDYDFIIGSVHGVDGVDIYHASTGNGALLHEAFTRQIHDEKTVEDCIRRYLVYSREMVELADYFDSFGHIDYISRYAPFAEKNFFYEKFPQEFDGLLKIISEKNIALEINTQMFGNAEKNFRAEKIMQKICTRFFELGGKICTIGSDAHNTKDIGGYIAAAKEIANASGLTPVYFKERKPLRCD